MTEGQTEGFKYTGKLHVSFWPVLVSASLSSWQPVTGRQNVRMGKEQSKGN